MFIEVQEYQTKEESIIMNRITILQKYIFLQLESIDVEEEIRKLEK